MRENFFFLICFAFPMVQSKRKIPENIYNSWNFFHHECFHLFLFSSKCSDRIWENFLWIFVFSKNKEKDEIMLCLLISCSFGPDYQRRWLILEILDSWFLEKLIVELRILMIFYPSPLLLKLHGLPSNKVDSRTSIYAGFKDLKSTISNIIILGIQIVVWILISTEKLRESFADFPWNFNFSICSLDWN